MALKRGGDMDGEANLADRNSGVQEPQKSRLFGQ